MKKEKSKNYITWPQKGAGNATMDMIGRFIAYRFMCELYAFFGPDEARKETRRSRDAEEIK